MAAVTDLSWERVVLVLLGRVFSVGLISGGLVPNTLFRSCVIKVCTTASVWIFLSPYLYSGSPKVLSGASSLTAALNLDMKVGLISLG